MKEEEATRCNIDPDVATVTTLLQNYVRCAWNQRFQYALHCGKRGIVVTCFPRKLAKVNFRHMDAAKEKPCIAKGSRKRWRKGRQNRLQGNGVSATAQLDLLLLCFFLNTMNILQLFAYHKP